MSAVQNGEPSTNQPQNGTAHGAVRGPHQRRRGEIESASVAVTDLACLNLAQEEADPGAEFAIGWPIPLQPGHRSRCSELAIKDG